MKKFAFPAIVILVLSCSASSRLPGFVYLRLNDNPTTLDPAHVVDVTGGLLCAKLFNGLVRIDENLAIVPDLAERWTVSGDGRTYTFHLRKGVRFSNGREVTARDFIFSFTRILAPGTRSPNTWVLDKIRGAREVMQGTSAALDGMRAPGSHTLVITLGRPFNPFLSLLTMTAAYVVPEEEVARHGGTFGFHPVGTGPFALTSWTPNVELRFAARSDYFEGLPRVPGLMYRVISEDLTAVTEFELGNLDVLVVPQSAYRHYRQDRTWKDRMSVREGLSTYYLGFNCSKPPFDRAEVRRAARHALDVPRMFSTIYEGRGRTTLGPVPDRLREWPVRPGASYDPARARELLRRAGQAMPVAADLYVKADQNIVDMAEVVQSYLNAAGFAVRIRQLEWSAFKEAVNRGEADLFYLSWWADYPDPENFLYPLFHSENIGPAGNRTRYADARVDRLIEEGQRAVSRRARNEAYGRAEQIIIDDAPWVPLWHANEYLLKQRWVRNYPQVPIYSSEKGTAIEVSELP